MASHNDSLEPEAAQRQGVALSIFLQGLPAENPLSAFLLSYQRSVNLGGDRRGTLSRSLAGPGNGRPRLGNLGVGP